MKKGLIFIIVWIICFVTILFLNTGFNLNEGLYIESLILGFVFSINLFFLKMRKIVLISSLPIFLLMVISYTFKRFDLSNIFGSTAMGIIVLTLITYLPQIVKKGYIQKK